MVRLVTGRKEEGIWLASKYYRSGFALCYANATRTTCSSPAAPLLFHVSLNLNTITSVVWIFTECIFNKNKLASNCLEKFFFWTLTFEDLILQQVDVFLYHLTRWTIFVFCLVFILLCSTHDQDMWKVYLKLKQVGEFLPRLPFKEFLVDVSRSSLANYELRLIPWIPGHFVLLLMGW